MEEKNALVFLKSNKGAGLNKHAWLYSEIFKVAGRNYMKIGITFELKKNYGVYPSTHIS